MARQAINTAVSASSMAPCNYGFCNFIFVVVVLFIVLIISVSASPVLASCCHIFFSESKSCITIINFGELFLNAVNLYPKVGFGNGSDRSNFFIRLIF